MVDYIIEIEMARLYDTHSAFILIQLFLVNEIRRAKQLTEYIRRHRNQFRFDRIEMINTSEIIIVCIIIIIITVLLIAIISTSHNAEKITIHFKINSIRKR